MASRGAPTYLSVMTEQDPYGHVAETKKRLRDNRERLARWQAGDGNANSLDRHQWLERIREDEAILRELGESDA